MQERANNKVCYFKLQHSTHLFGQYFEHPYENRRKGNLTGKFEGGCLLFRLTYDDYGCLYVLCVNMKDVAQ